MVDGININPSVPGAKVVNETESFRSLKQIKNYKAPVETKGTTNTPGSGADEEGKLAAALKKAADENLASGNVQDFLKAAEEIINKSLPARSSDTRLRIDQDDTTGIFIYQGIDKNSGEVVRQWPADEVLKFLSFYREQEGAEGIVVDVET